MKGLWSPAHDTQEKKNSRLNREFPRFINRVHVLANRGNEIANRALVVYFFPVCHVRGTVKDSYFHINAFGVYPWIEILAVCFMSFLFPFWFREFIIGDWIQIVTPDILSIFNESFPCELCYTGCDSLNIIGSHKSFVHKSDYTGHTLWYCCMFSCHYVMVRTF